MTNFSFKRDAAHSDTSQIKHALFLYFFLINFLETDTNIFNGR